MILSLTKFLDYNYQFVALAHLYNFVSNYIFLLLTNMMIFTGIV